MTQGQHGWEVYLLLGLLSSLVSDHLEKEIEATLHCISSVQEAVPLNDSPHLLKLFGPEILGKFPTSGQHRVRRTTTSLIGPWFNRCPVDFVWIAYCLQEPTQPGSPHKFPLPLPLCLRRF